MLSELMHVRLRGKRAMWTRPECRAERLSNIVASHAGFEGCLSQIMGHRGCRYLILQAGLLFQPRNYSMTSNEIQNFGNGSGPVFTESNRTQRTSVFVAGKKRIFRRFDDDGAEEQYIDAGVDYVVSFRLDYSEDKYLTMLRSRLRSGRYFGDQPYLGIRELPAKVDVLDNFLPADPRTNPKGVDYPMDTQGWYEHSNPKGLKTIDLTTSLGLTFYGTDWDDPNRPNYFAYLEVVHGLVKYPSWKEVRSLGIKRDRAA